MDTTKTGAVAVLVVALVAGVGYAYITGMGPLEENPTAGLDEPPETEATYSFGEVSETGGDGGDTDGQTNSATDDGEDAEDDANGDSDGTNGTTDAEETETQTDEHADEEDGTDDGTEESGDEKTVIGTQSETSRDERTDDGDEDDDSHRGGGGGDDVDNSGDYTDRRSAGAGTTTLQADTEYSGQPFVPELENMEECGETCREATVALQNKMSVDAENIVVYIRLYAGDSTAPEDVVWGENRELGTLGAGEVYRETETVDLTPQQANKVRETDGVVTAKATIQSDQATATFVEKDNVE